ncbi:hypothetical protein B0H66DRAFT_570935 [Apodospora peruviana]|uniref:Uncharacterized protein n=1 Tax=Apodospora peruviana TaxID=516989 RepID=A0AAE0HTE8_9PEZI|nr:hypothetical protein B0H66DRAFT_570935 [Apodospora peruviana]
MMPQDGPVHCEFKEQLGQPEPFGGIVGPGVIAAVVGTAWVAVGVTLLHYLFASHKTENPVDGTIARLTGCLPPLKWFKSRPGVQEAFAKTILTLSDIQTVVGFALLATGFLSLSSGISAYHFMLVVQIAWFAHVTQLAGLSVLRSDDNRSAIARWTRILLTLALAGVLITAIVPTLFFNWAYYSGSPFKFGDGRDNWHYPGGSASLPGSYAVCFFDQPRAVRWHYYSSYLAWKYTDTPAFGTGVTAMVLVGLNAVVRSLKLVPWLGKPARSARRGISRWWTSLLVSGSSGPLQRVGFYIGLATLLTVRVHTDLLISALSGIYWLLIPAIGGTISLARTRSAIKNVADDKWTFVQLLPVLILLVIFVTALGSFLTTTASSQQQQRPIISGDDDAEPLIAPTDEETVGSSFHDRAVALLERDYFYKSAWASSAVALLCLEVTIFTALCFTDMVRWGSTNAASVLALFAVPVLVGIPSAVFVFVLLCLVYEVVAASSSSSSRDDSESTARVSWYWVLMAVVLAATGVWSALFHLIRPWGLFDVLVWVLTGVGSAIGLLNLLAVVVLSMGRNRSAGIRLP